MLPPAAQKAIAILLALAGLFFILVGARSWMRAEGLSSRGVITRARLTEVRERGDSETGLVATYEFEVEGARYHRLGLFSEVATSITPEQARDPSGTIEVRYLPEDPSVNEVASGVTPSAIKQLMAIGFGVLMLLGAALRWWMLSKTRSAA